MAHIQPLRQKLAKPLKKLTDQQTFRLSTRSKVKYTLQRLDKKTKQAIYTSNNSGNTFKTGWDLIVYP
jgi:hypothetical protein